MMKMNVSVGELALRYTHPFGLSRWTTSGATNIVVRVSKDGIDGWGEGSPNRRYDDTVEKAKAFVTGAADSLAEFESDPSTFLQALSMREGSGAGRAALDLALHDWLAKSRDIPVYRLLGFEAPERMATSFTIGIDDPAVMENKTREAAPWPILKVKVGTASDEVTINSVRSVTDKPIRVDANEGWKHREEALSRIHWLQGQGVVMIEQPMPAGRLEDVAWLRERSSLPLIADEDCSTVESLDALVGVYHGVNIKLDKCGGLFEARRMVKRARRLGLQVMLGCMISSSLATTAAFHLSSRSAFVDLDGHLLIQEDPFVGLISTDGCLELPESIGLGVTPRRPVAMDVA